MRPACNIDKAFLGELVNPAEPSSGVKDHATELFAVVDACWRRTVETLCRSVRHASPPSLGATATEWVEETVFLAACRRRGLLSDVSRESSRNVARDVAVKRLGLSLFQVYRDRQPGDSLPVDEDALSSLARFDIGPETLGTIHQRLLGLRATFDGEGRLRFGRGKAAAKAGGIFYTPDWVARYMVDRAFECFDDGPSHDADKPPRVLDPACGCGAFLLAAYRRLRGKPMPISKDGQAVQGTHVEQTVHRTWRLGVSAVDPNRRAALERLHGVDLDEQAVLTARRAIWLATCDDPAGPLPPEETEVFFETIRPGNALTDPTFDQLAGAFDVVLGNPPYRRERGARRVLDEIARTELGRRWRTARMDLWYYFVHRAIELLADRGVLSLIVNSYWTAGSGAVKLVEHLQRETHVEEIFDLGGLAVFEQVAGRHMIFLAKKTRAGGATTTIKRPDAASDASAKSFLMRAAPLILFKKTPDDLFRDGRIDLEPVDRDLFEAMGRGTPLGRLGCVRQGIAENPATITREANRRHGDPW
ncbi:MAG TPA: hypothetical protein DD670_06125, partial [Planctomycetaceae bacterium]|nr:hypothetical protein [Planctomycetaceae bacterium]